MIHTQEFWRVFLFVGAVAAIFAFAIMILVRRFLSKQRTPLGRRSRAVLALAGIGVLCFAYGRFVEPKWVEVTRTRVATQRLPADHRSVRIVHLSDMHSNAEALLEQRLPALVAELTPDLIVFTGDCANSEAGIPVFRRCLEALAKIAPTFAVRGNWDPKARATIDVFTGTGAIELDGNGADVDVAGAKIHLVGLAFPSEESRFGEALAALDPEGPAIVLYHLPYPDLVPPALAARVDLMCAGHVHGGQVALPWYGAILTLSKFGKRFERGLYPTADGFGFPLYVSRGIGMEGSGAPLVRFCSRPEIALIELCPAR